MMATVGSNLLTQAQFREQFADRKPHYEFWFGEAVQKSMPTFLHSLLQAILSYFLRQAGYIAGTELELRVDPDWQPIPDVAGLRHWVNNEYPSEPVDVVIEVLSPDDRLVHVLEKCRQYARIGTRAIFWINPTSGEGWMWDRQREALQRVQAFELPNGKSIALNEVFAELEKQRTSGIDECYRAG